MHNIEVIEQIIFIMIFCQTLLQFLIFLSSISIISIGYSDIFTFYVSCYFCFVQYFCLYLDLVFIYWILYFVIPSYRAFTTFLKSTQGTFALKTKGILFFGAFSKSTKKHIRYFNSIFIRAQILYFNFISKISYLLQVNKIRKVSFTDLKWNQIKSKKQCDILFHR